MIKPTRQSLLAVFALSIGLAFVVPPASAEAPSIAAEMARLSGVVRAYQRATLSSELTARIEHIPFREGKAFKQGDVLVTFDCALYDAQLRGKRAERDARDKSYQTTKRLNELHAAGELDVQLAAAELNVAVAEVISAKVWVDRCEIRAPYDGRIVTWYAQEHEATTPGQKLLDIVDRSPREVEVIVPSHWIRQVHVGQAFQFRAEETGKGYLAKISEIAATIDPASQTLKLIARLQDANDVIPGMTGVADFGPDFAPNSDANADIGVPADATGRP